MQIEFDLKTQLTGKEKIDIDYLITEFNKVDKAYQIVKKYYDLLKSQILANLVHRGWDTYRVPKTQLRVKLIKNRKKEINYTLLRSIIGHRELKSLFKEKIEYEIDLQRRFKRLEG